MAESNRRFFDRLADVRAYVRSLTSGQTQRAVMRAIIDEAASLPHAQLASQTQPSGQAWKPLAATSHGAGARPPLVGLASELVVHAGESDGALEIREGWARFHSYGAHSRSGPVRIATSGKTYQRKDGRWSLPVRRIFPKGKLPAKWSVAFERAVKATLARFANS